MAYIIMEMRRFDISFEYNVEPFIEKKFFTSYSTKASKGDAIYWVLKIWRFRMEIFLDGSY